MVIFHSYVSLPEGSHINLMKLSRVTPSGRAAVPAVSRQSPAAFCHLAKVLITSCRRRNSVSFNGDVGWILSDLMVVLYCCNWI